MAALVVEASVAIATVLPKEATAYSDRGLAFFDRGETALVPALWHLETLNALLVRERRRTIIGDERDEALSIIRTYPVETDARSAEGAVIDAVQALAIRYMLIAYDAAYLELASRTRLPIATHDGALIQAPNHLGVPLF
jgi:predicted nucleic acid-binding protein